MLLLQLLQHSQMANHRRLRDLIWLLWRRRWAKNELAIAVAALLAILIFAFSLLSDLQSHESKRSRPFSSPAHEMVPLTLLHNAKDRGAFCLDGSVPGYHFQKGFGSGTDNWVLHIEGGGWCNTIESCSLRKKTALGSSIYMDRQVQFVGILSSDQSQNPDFFNWNKVKIRYCDGASFAGHPESEFKNGTELFFRGQLIWEALMDELVSVGLSNAKQALLTGCSAGGLATLIHCDNFREILPKDAHVKCLADAGLFLNEEDIAGNRTIESFYHDVVHLQGVAKSLDKNCIARVEPSMCFFPQEFIKNIKTPIFLVNPTYDFWQIRNILVPDASDPHGSWSKCKLNINNCNPSQMEVLQDFRGKIFIARIAIGEACISSVKQGNIYRTPSFRNSFLKTLGEFQKNKERGMFINSCFIHCQTWMAETWHSPSSPRINSKTIAESVGDWYFDKKEVKHVDCPYPCNPTCYHMDLSRH